MLSEGGQNFLQKGRLYLCISKAGKTQTLLEVNIVFIFKW